MHPESKILFLLLLLTPSLLGQNATESEEEEEDELYYDEGAQYNSTEVLNGNGTEIDIASNDTKIANSTHAPSCSLCSNSTVKNGTAVSSTTPMPTTTTPAPVNFPERAVGQIICTCDLLIGVCDVNCCCDPDCSKFDLGAFPQCQKTSTSENVCTTNGFLCIFKDNSPERLWLTNPKMSKTLKDFEIMSQRSPKWSWPEQEISTMSKFYPKEKYKAGDIVWSTRDNKTILPFSLPMLGRQCSKNATVLFLQDVTVTCSPLPDSPSLKYSYFKGLMLLADISLPIANQSEPWIKIKLYFCHENGTQSNCTESVNATALQPVKFQFHIFHNGSQGITDAKLLTWLEKKESTTRPTKMGLEVKYFWANAQMPSIARSGSPGYLQGLPIITGELSNNKTTVISIGHFNISSSDKNGVCNQERKILFGDDLLVTCEMALNWTSCVASDIIFNLAGRHLNAVTGAFGDSEEGTLKDWLTILVKEPPPSPITNCNRAPTSLMVQILWAKVGSLENPQSKLTGVMISFGGTRTITGQSVRLTTSVTFKEVTTGLKGLFAPPPKFEIRLPSDFFYPLFNSASNFHRVTFPLLCTCLAVAKFQ